ncbi:MAG: hypothetical protein EP330_22455 [Deltaproteobacteria bacterium]|nr:MAG: hypothetical protein EP330_22455 [Deltaproteobacteria bacterium]
MLRRLFLILGVFLVLPALAQEPEESEENKLISDSLTPKKGRLAARLTPFADGLIREGAWSPLHVQLANGGDAFELTLHAEEMGSDYNLRSFDRVVEMPEGGRKDAVLYVRPGRSSGTRRLMVRGDAERSGAIDYPVRKLGMDDVGIGIIGEENLGIVAIRDAWRYGVPSAQPKPHASGQRSVRAGLVPETAMPDRALGWSAVDWVVWPEADPTAVSGEALDGLLGWVATGGHLFVTVTDGYARIQGTPLSEALPVTISGVQDTEALAGVFQSLSMAPPPPVTVPRAVATAKEDPQRHVEVLATIEGDPAWVMGSYGLGTVHVLTLDLAQAPFTQVTQRDALWRRLLWLPEPLSQPAEVMFGTNQGYWDPTRQSPDYTREYWVSERRDGVLTEDAETRMATLVAMSMVITDPGCMPYQGTSHPTLAMHWTSSGQGLDSWTTALRQELSDIPGVAPLPLSWLMAFAGLYLLVIGPIDYGVLRLLDRQPWTWITFPITIALFSGVALVGTTLTKGSQAVMTRIEVVDALPGTPFMRGESWFGVFATSKTEVGVKSTRDGALVEPLGDGGFMTEVIVGSGEASGDLTYLAQTWSLAYGQTAWVDRADGGYVEVETLDNGQYALTSRLPVSLDHARLRFDGRSVNIGELDPDQSVTVGTNTGFGVIDDRTRFVLDAAGDFYDEAMGGHLHDGVLVGVLAKEYDGLELSGLWPQRDAITIYRVPVRIEK